jgi:hypothetical protein
MHTFQLGMTASLGQLGRQLGGGTEPLLVRQTWPPMRLAACAVEWLQQGGPLRAKGFGLFTRTMQGQPQSPVRAWGHPDEGQTAIASADVEDMNAQQQLCDKVPQMASEQAVGFSSKGACLVWPVVIDARSRQTWNSGHMPADLCSLVGVLHVAEVAKTSFASTSACRPALRCSV